jgi:hypothetical protein
MSESEDWAFARACDLARTADEGFAMAEIAEIEAMWQQVDLDHGDFGFILAMADGRRLYWRFVCEDAGAGRPEDLEVSELGPGEIPPADAPWSAPDALNKRLAVLRRVV